MTLTDAEVLGMPLTKFEYKGVYGHLSEGDDWATIYNIQSANPGNGEAQEALMILKNLYSDKRFGSTVALNPTMKHILEKLEITEYDDERLLP
jgi:hypothetical protein